MKDHDFLPLARRLDSQVAHDQAVVQPGDLPQTEGTLQDSEQLIAITRHKW